MQPSSGFCPARCRARHQQTFVKQSLHDVRLTQVAPTLGRRHLAHLSARQISPLTLEAVANAVAAGRKELRLEDFPRWLFDDDAAAGESSTTPNYLH